MKSTLSLIPLLLLPAVFGPAAADDKSPVIPIVRLSGQITEKPVAADSPFNFGPVGQSLHSLLNKLDTIRNDQNVPAIVLEPASVIMGRAQTQELTRALKSLRDAGKKIHIHTDMLTTGQYAIAASASEISMVPTGNLFITGLYGEMLFVRGLLDKVGVTPDYLTCGDYKSAGEMFMRTAPSKESAEMSDWLYGDIFESLLSTIATGRGVSTDQARGWIDAGVYTAETALEAGVIDVVEHHHDFEQRLKDAYGDNIRFDRRYGKKKSAELDLSSPFGLMNFYAELLSPPTRKKNTTPAVGIVYLEGSILPGGSGGNPFLADAAAFGDSIRKSLDQAAEDDAIKAVVFRVNSPGGSAVASEVILNACKRVAAKKPLIVSMGDVAASGGYYVSCATDTIFAEASTITGSIGVVSGKFGTTQMWNKLGITFTPIQYGQNASLLSTASVFTDSEKQVMQRFMDDTYTVFKGHVTAARGDKLKKPIEKLAGGRVYTGRQALELGLVDRIGGLHDAVAFAAARAKLEDPDVRIVPRPKNFMELLMSDLNPGQDDGRHLALQNTLMSPVLQTVVPLLQDLDPARVLAVKHALLQLSILQSETVSLTMPVMTLTP